MSDDLSPLFRERTDSEERPRFSNPSIEAAVVAITELTQAPEMIAVQSVLFTLSVATQGHRNVLTLGGSAPLSLDLITVAKSGERKSSCDTLACKILLRVQSKRLATYQLQLTEQSEKNNTSDDAVIEGCEDSWDQNGQPQRSPINPTILFGDVTFEAILEHFIDGNPSIGLKSDDGGQFFGGHSMRRENKLKTAAGLSRLWDGTTIDRHRVGSGSHTFTGRRTSIHLMIQEGIANDVLADPTLADQGLTSRFLIAWPTSRIGYRTIDDLDARRKTVKKSEAALEAFEQRINELVNRQLPTAPHDSRVISASTLSHSDEAGAALTAFYNRVEIAQRPGGVFEQIEGFASKIAEQACRISGILTVYEDPESDEVDIYAMKNGIEFCEWYLQEMRRLRECGLVSSDLREAEKLRKWLNTKRAEAVVTPRDIARNGPQPAYSAEYARVLMSILEEHNCVEAMPRNSVIDGVAVKQSWRVPCQ